MLNQLLDMLADKSSRSSLITFSYPSIVALYDEDIIDAAQFVSVHAVQGYHHYHTQLAEYSADALVLYGKLVRKVFELGKP